jgi:glycosyltransferase involved in cell wall biosynthesis
VYPGIDKRFFSPSLSDIEKVKKRYNLKSNYILSVGTLEPRKNIKRVLKAFERFKEHRLVKDKGPVELILVGREGWGTDYKLSQSVRSLGFVPDNFLPALYKNARLFVYPSLYEGFGFPVLEAMAAECPVLTSDRGSLKEISGNSAILVDPEDVNSIAIKMVQGYIDTAFRSDITSHAKQHAEQFSWSKAANLIRNIYESLVR